MVRARLESNPLENPTRMLLGELLRTQGDRVDLSLPDAAGVLGELLDRLAGAGVALIGLEVHPPTLDDVFLSLTGHGAQEEAK